MTRFEVVKLECDLCEDRTLSTTSDEAARAWGWLEIHDKHVCPTCVRTIQGKETTAKQ